MLSELRPYRRRLVLLVVLAALGGAALGEFAPSGGTKSKKTPTATSHGARHSPKIGLH